MYNDKMKLGGVIYLRSIKDKTSNIYRNLPMLRQLCGDNTLARVVLGTTHWGEVDENEGEIREQQLAKIWKDLGSMSLRFDQTDSESCARAFLDVILGQLEFGGNGETPEGRDLRFKSLQSTDVDSPIQNDPERTNMKDHPVMILCVFSCLFIAIGTDSWC